MSATDSTPVEQTPEGEDNLDDFAADFFSTVKVEEDVADAGADEPDDVDNADADAEDDEPEDKADEPEDSDGEEEDDSDDEPEPEPKPKNRKTAKERIQELAAKNRERDARIAELETLLAKKEEPKTVPTKAAEGMPDPDAVDDKGEPLYPLGRFDEKYAEDCLEYRLNSKLAAIDEKAEADRQAREEQAAQAELVTKWNSKLDAVSAEIPDLRENIKELEEGFASLDPEHGIFIASNIMQLSRGPEVLNFLADNPDTFDEIVELSPTQALIALGEIQAQLPKKGSVETKKVSTAKAPPTSTRGNGASKAFRADTDDLDAFERGFFKK
jgi:hypothetical protein